MPCDEQMDQDLWLFLFVTKCIMALVSRVFQGVYLKVHPKALYEDYMREGAKGFETSYESLVPNFWDAEPHYAGECHRPSHAKWFKMLGDISP